MKPLVDGRALASLGREDWDLLIVGGGITGAGIFLEGARAGLRVLLVEGGDFASGTSSRSSKLVHGGLHYLARFDAGLALEAARERNHLLERHPGLVRPLTFFLPVLRGDAPGTELRVRALLGAYRLLAPSEPGGMPRRLGGRGLPAPFAPGTTPDVRSVHQFLDARTDDAGLVLRVLAEGVGAGGVARNYTRALGLIRRPDGDVAGARILDVESGLRAEIRARVVVNATGPWTDTLRIRLGLDRKVRKVRGSHLVLPWHRLPLPGAVVHQRPSDGSAVVMIPWKGVTLVGGTSVDVSDSTGGNEEPRIGPDEFRMLLEDVWRVFPGARVEATDVIATFSGLRPILAADGAAAATASRRDGIWLERGLLTVAGGKLTTYRAMARRALAACSHRLPLHTLVDGRPAPEFESVPPELRALASRYGTEGARRIGAAPPWRRLPAELAWCARAEGVLHLDDLLLRRTRIGFTNPEGGAALLPRIRPALKRALGWDEDRWHAEVDRYLARWRRSMAPPHAGGDSSGAPGARSRAAGSGARGTPGRDPSFFPWSGKE